MSTLAIVTGGSAGIGRALLDHAPADAERVDVSRRGCDLPGVDHLAADLSDPTSWSTVAAALEARIRTFHGSRVSVVLNAGVIAPIGPADVVDPEAYARSVLLNGAAPQVLGQRLLGPLARHPASRRELVVVSSGAARTVYPGWSAYAAAKAAVDHWCRTVAAEQASAPRPVRVLAIAPGVVATDMQTRIRATEEARFPAVERFRQLHRTGELADPDDVARRLWASLDDDEVGPVLDLRHR